MYLPTTHDGMLGAIAHCLSDMIHDGVNRGMFQGHDSVSSSTCSKTSSDAIAAVSARVNSR